MKTITDITPQVKNPKRCSIFLDGEFFCGLSLEAVMKNRLKIGARISATQLEEIQLESDRVIALDKAMTFLSGAIKTEKQTRDYLKEKGFSPLVVNFVMDKLNEYGYIDDGEYAKRYVETYSNKKGARLMKMELAKKGVNRVAVDEVVDEIGDQSAAVTEIARKYIRGKDLSDVKTGQKLYRYLLSKGFSYDDARVALDAVKLEQEDM